MKTKETFFTEVKVVVILAKIGNCIWEEQRSMFGSEIKFLFLVSEIV